MEPKARNLRPVLVAVALLTLGMGLAVSPHAVAANGGTIYVDVNASGANTGASWTDAYTSLQQALDSASPGDEIWVAQGTYKPSAWPNGGTTGREKHFSLKNGVQIYGGFPGG